MFSKGDQPCIIDDDCHFMFYCDAGLCQHKPVFPLQLYPILIYILIPIACGLCNLTGSSMGIFKITILMNCLRYHVQYSTALIQAVVIGAALPNFLSIIRQKHPNGKTSLVNFNLVYIFIPCSLIGSTFGTLLENILPQLIQYVLMVLMFSYFTYHFFQKIRKQNNIQNPLQQSLVTTQTQQSITNNQSIIIPKNNNDPTQQINNYTQQTNQQQVKLVQQIQKYQISYHAKDIVLSFVVFIIFQLLAFVAQGKIKIQFLNFNKCSIFYVIGLVSLTIITYFYLIFIKKVLHKKAELYQKAKIMMEIKIGQTKTFWKLALGGFSAGFIQGTLGMGAGTFLMVVLLGTDINSMSAAATSGYQILFIGSGALTQQFINDKINPIDAAFFFIWSTISGGIVTFLLYKFIRKLDPDRVKAILMKIILGICLLSVILVFPVAIQRIVQKGWAHVMKFDYKC